MKSWKTIKTAGAALVAGTLAVSLAACGSSNAGDKTAGDDAKQSGPIEIEIWGWSTTGEQVVEAFNKSQDEVKAKYVLEASNTATQQNFNNAFKAKKDLPDLVQGFTPLVTTVANGWAEDITDSVKAILDDYNEGAKESAQVNGQYYGIPGAGTGAFMLINTDTLAKIGGEAPKTWDEALELGKKAAAQGIKLYNLAGEDPSGLEQMAQLAGAEWFKIDGDRWVVNFTDDKTMKAADVIQQMIDGDMVSNQTYKDKPALYSFFDSGNLTMITCAYWSVTGYKTNFPNSSGKWAAYDYPQFEDNGEYVSPDLGSNASFIPKGTDKAHQDAVMKYIHFTNTDEGIDAGRDPELKTTGVPAGLNPDKIDLDKYIEENIPDNFYTDDAEAAKVIKHAVESVPATFALGPNYDAWFPELQDQWGKAVAKQQTVKQALENTQKFVAEDLESKGINFKIG